MTFTKTEKILAVGTAFFFAAAVAAHFFVALKDLQAPIWGIFLAFQSSLMLCLKIDGAAVDPTLTRLASEVGTTLQPYAQHYVPFNVPLQNGTVYPPSNNGVAYTVNAPNVKGGVATSGNIQATTPVVADSTQPTV